MKKVFLSMMLLFGFGLIGSESVDDSSKLTEAVACFSGGHNWGMLFHMTGRQFEERTKTGTLGANPYDPDKSPDKFMHWNWGSTCFFSSARNEPICEMYRKLTAGYLAKQLLLNQGVKVEKQDNAVVGDKDVPDAVKNGLFVALEEE